MFLLLHVLSSSLWCFYSENFKQIGQYYWKLGGKNLRMKVHNAQKVN